MKSKSPILVVLFVGLLARILVLAVNYNSLEFDGSFVIHGEIARNILNGNGLRFNPDHVNTILHTWRSQGSLVDLQDIEPPQKEYLEPMYIDEPGYGLFLAGIWKIFGSQRWVYPRVIQVIVDVWMVLLLYLIGKCLWSERVGLIVAFLYAILVPHIELVVRPHRDVWVTFAFISSVFILVQLFDSSKPRKAVSHIIILALSLAVTAWMRSTIVAYVVACSIALLLLRPGKTGILWSVALVGVFLVAMTPLVARNYEAFGKVMITRGSMWHSFWAGIGQFSNSYGIIENDKYIAEFFERKDSTARYGTDRYEEVLKAEGMSLIQERPIWYASTVARRALVILSPKIGREILFQKTSRESTTGIVNRELSGRILLLIDALFLAGLITGVWVSRFKGKLLLVVTLPLLYTIVTLSPLYIVGRNILNVYFVTLILTSVAIEFFWTKVRRDSGSMERK